MSSSLDRIQDWQEHAQRANLSVAALAKKTGVSVRMLERQFLQSVGKSPKAWLVEQRQKRAIKLIRDGYSIKETAGELGFRYPHHFSRQFKLYWGFCPSTPITFKQAGARQRRVLVN